MELHILGPHESRMCPIYFGVKRSRYWCIDHELHTPAPYESRMCPIDFGVKGHEVLGIENSEGCSMHVHSTGFCNSVIEFRSAVTDKKSKISQLIRGQGGHLGFPIDPKKHKVCIGRWDIVPCPVSLNSVQWFQRSRKCLSQSETRAAILFFRSIRKTQTR